MSRQKVSIILPVYNGERFLRQAIESILNQTYENWELWIVDDCSTDGTAHMIEHFMRRDARIHVIHNAVNQKLPRSLNIGFQAATGEYLTWTSDDNVFLPNAIERMAHVLDMNPDIRMVCADEIIIDENNAELNELGVYEEKKIFGQNCLGACFLYRREVLEIVGEYDDSLFCVEDYDYWLRVLKHYHHIERIPEVLYRYRRHTESLTAMKKQLVAEQLTKMRYKHFDYIMDALKSDKELLCKVYCQMMQTEHMTVEIRERFLKQIPELAYDLGQQEERDYIIFGAGNYGKHMQALMGEKAVCFADNNPALQGTYYNDLEIYSVQNAYDKFKDAIFLISVSCEKIYGLLQCLSKSGIRDFSLCQQWVKDWQIEGTKAEIE